jgi:hypothetical protein
VAVIEIHKKLQHPSHDSTWDIDHDFGWNLDHLEYAIRLLTPRWQLFLPSFLPAKQAVLKQHCIYVLQVHQGTRIPQIK